MCGISGFCGKSYNPYILKILNLFNQERGQDSIGIVVNDTRTISIGHKAQENTGKASIFQQGFIYPNSKSISNRTVLQHNRARSYGAINEESVHPYEYEYSLEGDDTLHTFFFMHNGTLKDPHILARHYKENFADYATDSHLLGALILKHGIKVLQDYNGAAACAFYWSHEPNTISLWKGRSEQTTGYNAYSQSTYVADERPLYFVQSKEGMYFASEKGFLTGCGFETVAGLASNTVVKFQDGKVIETTKLERKPIIEKPKPLPPVSYSRQDNTAKVININVVQEEHDPRSFIIDKIVHYKNKYYLNGTALDGIFSVNLDYSIDEDFLQGEPHYFIDGFWIKDKRTYEKITTFNRNNKGKKYELRVQRDMHFEALTYVLVDDQPNVKKYYYNDRLVHNVKRGLIKPKFCYFYYSFDEKSNLLRTYHPAQAIEDGLLTPYQVLYVEKFNFHTTNVKTNDYYYLSTADECRRLAKEEWSWDLDFSQLDDFPVYIMVNKKYESEITELDGFFNLDTREDLALADFNNVHSKFFITRQEANDWYNKTHGVPYAKTWPLSETKEIPF